MHRFYFSPRTSETAFVIHCLELTKRLISWYIILSNHRNMPTSFPSLAAQDFVREKHKAIKCQEQLTSAFFTQHRMRQFYSAPIIKVNKNEYRSPQRPKSCRFLWPQHTNYSPPWGRLMISLEMPGMNESVPVFHSYLCSSFIALFSH